MLYECDRDFPGISLKKTLHGLSSTPYASRDGNATNAVPSAVASPDWFSFLTDTSTTVSYTHLRAHETLRELV